MAKLANYSALGSNIVSRYELKFWTDYGEYTLSWQGSLVPNEAASVAAEFCREFGVPFKLSAKIGDRK